MAAERYLEPSGLDPSCRSPRSSDHCFGLTSVAELAPDPVARKAPEMRDSMAPTSERSRLAALADLSGFAGVADAAGVLSEPGDGLLFDDPRCGCVPGDPAPLPPGIGGKIFGEEFGGIELLGAGGAPGRAGAPRPAVGGRTGGDC